MEPYNPKSLSRLIYPYTYLYCQIQLNKKSDPVFVYVFKQSPNNSITYLIEEPSPENPDSKQWEIHSGFPYKLEFIKYKDLPDDCLSQFLKLGKDQNITYGDGGYASLVYPIYYFEHLPIPTETKTQLISDLNRVGGLKNDWHDECPVLDIIDPDFAPNYYIPFKEPCSERSKYSWIPTDITCLANGNIKLHGPIHNLNTKGNKRLYHSIFSVFKAMIPALIKLKIVHPNSNTKLQVVIKAQKYVIQPGTSYSGKWHLEGKTENINAVGVYYCKIDSGFENDELEFKPRVGPDEGYAEIKGISTELMAPIKENTAVVFRNTLPHRFSKLTNSTDQPLERLFLNFFIVSRDAKLESTTTRHLVTEALKSVKKLSSVLIREILSFIFYIPTDYEAKERRKISRFSMNNEKTGWGYIHYGNSGDVEFIDEGSKRKLSEYNHIVY